MTNWFNGVDWDRFAGVYHDPWNAFVMAIIMAGSFVCLWYSRFPNLSPSFGLPRGGAAHRCLVLVFTLCWGLQVVVQFIGFEAVTGPPINAADMLRDAAQYSASTVAAKSIFLFNLVQITWVFWLLATNTLIRAAVRQVLHPDTVGNVIVTLTDMDAPGCSCVAERGPR